MADKIEELKKIKELFDQGVITEDEFKKLKSKIIGIEVIEIPKKSSATELKENDNLLKKQSISKEDATTSKTEVIAPNHKAEDKPLESPSKEEVASKASSNNSKNAPAALIEDAEPKNKTRKPIIIGVVILAVIGGGYLIWDNFFNDTQENTTANTEATTANTVYVLSGELNFRSDKNVNASIIEALPFGAQVELVGSAESPVYEEDLKIVWQEAKWGERYGWIAKSIDDQDVVGDIEVYDDFNKLFSSEYGEEAGYGEMKVWAYYALIEYMKEQGWLGTYTIRNDALEIREDGLKTVLRFKQNLNEKDKDDHYDFITLLESPEDKIVIYLRADSDNSGSVIDWEKVPNNVSYLVKKRKGEEYAASGNYGVDMREMNETWLAAADNDGALTTWLVPSENQLDLEPMRFLESRIALDILSNKSTGYDFVSENSWYEFNDYGAYSTPPTYWVVKNDPYSDGFTATQYIKDYGQMTENRKISSEWKARRYVTGDFQKAKLLIDTDMNKLILYLRDNSGNSITMYGCIEQSLVLDYLINRDDYVEEEYGC